MLSAGIWDSEERSHWSRNKRNKEKWEQLKWKWGGVFQDHGEQEALAWFPSGSYEKTLEESSISVTGCDLHAEQITPASRSGRPEPVGCHGENVQKCPIMSQPLVR